MVRVLQDGSLVKQQVDAVIDHCGEMHNLREFIFTIKVGLILRFCMFSSVFLFALWLFFLLAWCFLLSLLVFASFLQFFEHHIFASIQLRSETAVKIIQRAEHHQHAINLLIRYIYLICFNGYLRSTSSNHFVPSFVEWLQERPFVDNICRTLTLE